MDGRRWSETRSAIHGAGNLISKEETGYVLVGGVPVQETYITQYTYNGLGQLIRIDGPRRDVSDTTTFAYYENSPEQGDNRGQLKAIVNALGQRTEFSAYDANGNVGRITDPNGVATFYTYLSPTEMETEPIMSMTTSQGSERPDPLTREKRSMSMMRQET